MESFLLSPGDNMGKKGFKIHQSNDLIPKICNFEAKLKKNFPLGYQAESIPSCLCT